MLLRIAALCLLAEMAAGAQEPDLPPGEPVGAIVRVPKRPARPCELELALRTRHAGDRFVLTARGRNRTRAPLRVVVPDECSGGPVKFVGITPEYDFYGRCNVGPCVQRSQRVIVLGPGETRDLAKV